MSPLIRKNHVGKCAVAVAVMMQWAGSLVLAQNSVPSAAPAANSASVAGAVRDEAGTPVEAWVTIATKGLRQRALTAPDGTFQFRNLKMGKYSICAQPTGRNAKPQDDPFVDSCLWQDRTSLKVMLAAGQSRTGVAVPVTHGYAFRVRVNDPGGQLPASAGKLGGNSLSVFMFGPSGLAQPVPIGNQDRSGRDQTIVIPYDTACKLVIHSSTLLLKDANGKDLGATNSTDVRVPRGGPPASVTVSVGGRRA